MKKGGGIIIRLIDIVMNLLFGFLMISDIVHKTEIKLPSQAGRSPVVSEKRVMPIEVQIFRGDTTIIGIDPQTERSLRVKSQLYGYYVLNEDERLYRIRMLDKLEDHLFTAKASYDSINVIINPDAESIVQSTINLVDICRRYRIEKRFRFIERGEE
ncbi:MAG: biopolymer transporter ExbD [candidate division KSB1 bacterium]|nr:biopolymer transporter ExbD [candidate division KSB1 bacterium]MDZ7336238.1 biopolymer transporter ExbD [candidate division KSB1 bacterium]MDZ7357271.1 biopolymer transporter ExbD [candidate division KSB1 bacterium]MDZ7375977.1 biopolymer transporter ExbD [candidate division KSB1 bacterium]MDZ7402101.1 biopolymer transporter ExbD [candidate division KSB1 bacterium]